MCDTDSFPLPSVLREALTKNLDIPVVFQNQTKSWSAIPWTVADMAEKYGDVLLNFHMVPKNAESISWEGCSFYVRATVSQFISWQNGDIQSNSPLKKFNASEYWAYSSYNYMNYTFPEGSDILKVFNWDVFGFPEVTGKESTFWLGSKGSYTPCHMDSYGCNLHAQIMGKKKWVLFPPQDTPFMYPTRIPYEESSVFSSVDISNPDLSLHPLFKNSHPYVVVLEPGDVLFIPKKWWHFVLNLDDVTFSINTWIQLDSDCESRLEEAVAQSLMSCFISNLEPPCVSWLNPREEYVPPEDAVENIILAIAHLNQPKISCNDLADENPSRAKVCKTLTGTDVHSTSTNAHCLLDCKDVRTVTPIPFSEWFTRPHKTTVVNSSCTQEITVDKILNCFVHPDVVAVISRLLRDSNFVVLD